MHTSAVRFAGRFGPDEFWRRHADSERVLRDEAHKLPLYGVANWSAGCMVGDWERINDELTTVGLAHRDHPLDDKTPLVTVYTTSTDPRDKVAGCIAQLLGPSPDDGGTSSTSMG